MKEKKNTLFIIKTPIYNILANTLIYEVTKNKNYNLGWIIYTIETNHVRSCQNNATIK